MHAFMSRRGAGAAQAWRPALLPAALAVLLLLPTGPASAQQRPLQTDDAALLGVGRVRAELGIEFLQGQRYPLSGLRGDLTRLGLAAIHVGVGEYAEFQLSGVVQDFLSVTSRTSAFIAPDFDGNATSDFGDIVLGTKLRMASESAGRPALAFKFAVQLPNASNESGLGTDQTHFFAAILASKSFGRTTVLGNLGLAILGSAVEPNTQNDKLTYGLGLIVRASPEARFVAEVFGREGPERAGNENQAQVRLGFQFAVGSLRWNVAGIAGLRRYDADTGVALGVTYEFQAFHRDKKPKTIR
ncbi:MAG: hypothetical protein ABIG68_13245 [Acidobacteriota bacterium]